MLLDRTATTKNVGAREVFGQGTGVGAQEARNIRLQKIEARMNEVPQELQSYLFKNPVRVGR